MFGKRKKSKVNWSSGDKRKRKGGSRTSSQKSTSRKRRK